MSAFDDIRYKNVQNSIFNSNLYNLHLDEIAKPLLERTLHQQLHSGDNLGAAGTEDKA
jgi:DNA-binding protein Fis